MEYVEWHSVIKKKAIKISYLIPFICKHCLADDNKSFCALFIWDTRAVYSTNWFAAHSFNTLETEIYRLSGFYSRKITR